MTNEAELGNGPPESLGQSLVAAREAKGLSVEEIADSLKLRPRQILALETEDFESLSGPTYVRGMIRNYARLVDIDPEPLLVNVEVKSPVNDVEALESSYLSACPASTASGLGSSGRGAFSRWLNRLPIVLAILAVILGLVIWAMPQEGLSGLSDFVVARSVELKDWWRLSHPSEKELGKGGQDGTKLAVDLGTDPAPATFVEPEPIASDSKIPDEERNSLMGRVVPSPTPSLQATLTMSFKEDAWVEIKEVRSRRIVQSGLVRAGNDQTFTGALPLTLKIGNAEAVGLDFNGTGVNLSPYSRDGVARLLLQ